MKRFKSILALICAVAAIFISHPGSSQEWHWVRDDRMFNPSGLYLIWPDAQFRVVDWNQDQKLDFVINQPDTIELFLNISDAAVWRWRKANINFPAIKPTYESWLYPIVAFDIFDFDGDNDYDLIADGLHFWRNEGTNEHPIWVQEDSVLKGLNAFHYNPFHVDVDNDGNWDLLSDRGNGVIELAINEGDHLQPVWRIDSLFFQYLDPWLFKSSLIDYDHDGDKDLFAVRLSPADPIPYFDPVLFENIGSALQPQWSETDELRGLYWYIIRPCYEIVDLNQDGHLDYLMTDSEGHLAFYFGQGSPDSLDINPEARFLVGNLSSGKPFLFDYQTDGDLDLIISQEELNVFGESYYYEGSVVSFVAKNHHFDLNDPDNNWFPNPMPLVVANFTRDFYFNFCDFDGNGDQDYIFSFYKVDLQEKITGSQNILYRNQGNSFQPNWVADPDAFARFNSPDSLFYAPCLVDIDNDNDLDVLIKRKDAYTFYENVTNLLSLTWKENRAFLKGINSTQQRWAVFADLTQDGLLDLIFVGMNRKLSLYVNTGNSTSPAWKYDPTAFLDLDLEFCEAPVFGDMDNDGDLDIILNSIWLTYFRNETQTGIVAKAPSEQRLTCFLLYQNYPNPFNAATTIRYDLPRSSFVTLEIYNFLGQKVRALVAEDQKQGEYQIKWDGHDEWGNPLPSGIYLSQLKADTQILIQKIALIK